MTAAPRSALARPGLHLTLLGQALIQHDLRGDDWPDMAPLAALCARADACFTDLETAIRTPSADPPTRAGVFLHAADPVVLECLGALSVSLLATANNHVWDLGTGGIVGMVRELDARGFAHAGAGGDLTAAAAPAYLRARNGSVALVAAASGAIREGAAATPTRAGVNELRRGADGALDIADTERILAAVAEAAGRADVVLACHHNHLLDEGGRRTPPWQRDFAHRCIDAGAALYVSHGAPRLQGIEVYRERPIFYDLGNFIFQTATEEGFYDDEVWQSVVAECRFDAGRFCGARLTPVQLNARGSGGPADLATRGRPSLARDAAAAAILARLEAVSRPFGTAFEHQDGAAVIRGR
ncbi:MAG TPA: CapA family protein [Stellaceae bacterium]|jgi:poly-gamma-glutamate capsule biosynthesis protein CapA/YwtB (metallophosphatase superfamily)|nr:CapA family protein [Stellaceae bacterium]